MAEQRSATQTRRNEENQPSRLLLEHENNDVYQIIGKRSVTLSTTVVQVFQCSPRSNQWQKLCVGVACFVKDNLRKSYFIKVVNFAKCSVVWEQEIYNQFTYHVKGSQFHSFEADDFVAGLNFADQEEASHFRNTIEEKLAIKQQRKMERRQTTVKRDATRNTAHTNNSSPALQPIQSNQISPPATVSPSLSLNDVSKNKKNKQQKSGKKPKITKDDIGTPSDFRHVGHVGWDPKGGFDVDNIDPQWKKLFDTIGVTENQLQDEETSQFIYDFVEQHGGIEKATKELEKTTAPPPPPARSAPVPPTSRAPPPRGPAPLPPGPAPQPPGHKTQPARTAPPPPQPGRAAPPPPPTRHGGAPPPPATSAPRAPPPSRQLQPRAGPPPPPPAGVPAPPPPPPPPPVGIPAPPPPPMTGGPPPPPPPFPSGAMGVAPPAPAPASGVGRGGLLDQIHSGMQLKKVESSQSAGGDGDRSNLLHAIRAGAQLKSVSEDDRQSANPSELEGMAGALAKALAKRKEHIQVDDDDDDEDDDDDFDDEDWSD